MKFKEPPRMIRWKLRVLMAERQINNKQLIADTGLSSATISRLKNTNELKQITGDVLDALCIALDCTPNDLIEFKHEDSVDPTGKLSEKRASRKKREAEPKKKADKDSDNSTEAIAA